MRIPGNGSRRPRWIAILPAIVAAWHPGVRAAGWGGSLGISSDYVYRGLTQSGDRPSIQGDLHYAWNSGWFAGLSAASVRFRPDHDTSLEMNGYAGRAFEFDSNWSAELAYVHYAYPGITPHHQYEYDEVAGTVGWRQHAFLSVAASPDRSIESTRGTARSQPAYAYELALHQPLPHALSANAGVGYYDLDRLVGTGYVYWNAGLGFNVRAYELDVAYIGTDAGARSLFYNQVAADRVVATLRWHF